MTVADRLNGREQELRVVEDFLDRAGSAPSVLLLSGEAGIGKTGLWQAALQLAQGRGPVSSHSAQWRPKRCCRLRGSTSS